MAANRFAAYSPRRNTVKLSASEAAPFKTLAKRVQVYAGSIARAAHLLGVDDKALKRLMYDDHLTNTQGHKILAGYRAIKHQLSRVSNS